MMVGILFIYIMFTCISFVKGMVLYVFYGYHHSVERLQRRASKTKDKYQVVSACNGVTSSMPGYGSTVHEQQLKFNLAETETFVD